MPPYMARELLNLTELGRYLNVSADRARRVAADELTFPGPASDQPRRWSRARVERWGERHWWEPAVEGAAQLAAIRPFRRRIGEQSPPTH